MLGASVGAVAVLLAVLALGYAGLAPWSTAMPGYHANSHPATDPESFFSARSAAQTAASSYLNQGSWLLIGATGVALHNATTYPGPSNYSYGVTPPCGWSTPAGNAPSAITIPATPAGTASGEASAWVLEFVPSTPTSATPALVVVTVLGGQASVYGVMAGPGCPTLTSENMSYGDLSSGVIDSTQAAGVANSWGGSAFLANFSSANVEYTVTASVTVHLVEYIYPPCYGNYSNCNGTWSNTTPPVPSNWGYGVVYDNYTTPSLWDVSYSTTPMGYPGSGMMNTSGNSPAIWAAFTASLSAANGTLNSVIAYTSGYGGCYYGCYAVPPSQPMGPGGAGGSVPLAFAASRGALTG